MMTRNRTQLLLQPAAAFLLVLGVQARTWTSADGTQTFEGELQSYDAASGKISVTLPNGKRMAFLQEKLSAEDIDSRVDCYALACVAYEMLSGGPIFTSRKLVELIRQKLTFKLPPAAEIGDGVSDSTYEFLRAALDNDADRRPASLAPWAEWAALVKP